MRFVVRLARLIWWIVKLPIMALKYTWLAIAMTVRQLVMIIRHPILRPKFLLGALIGWIRYLRNHGDNILVSMGIHSIVALMGGGKTLLSNMIVQDMMPPDRFVYVIDRALTQGLDDGRAVYCDIFACFKGGKQIYRLPLKIDNRRCYGLILDEIVTHFNRRVNNRSDYNDRFLGLIEMCMSLRHQGIKRIWLLSQSYDNLDIQLMRLNKYRHLVYSKRAYSYTAYLSTRKMLVLPYKLKIVSQVRDDRGEYESVVGQVLPVDYNRHITTYDHQALAAKYNELPVLTIYRPNKQ